MPKLPKLTGKDLIKLLSNFGFEVKRIRGSHYILKHKDGRTTVVPVHSKEIIGPGLLTKILRDCEINKNEITKLL
jgi:predicted RNA binding protein YcfA (HicA-like mRNA interferase family)